MVGCSELIADRKINVLQMRDVERFMDAGLQMKDGTVVACDAMVLATGFKNMQEGIRRIVGDEIACRVGPVWGFNESGLLRNMWRRKEQENFWVTGSTLIDSRFVSRFLAIEIKTELEGFLPEREALPLARAAANPPHSISARWLILILRYPNKNSIEPA